MAGQWFTVTRTADGTTSVTRRHSDGDSMVIGGYRGYYGDERDGEQVDSRCGTDNSILRGNYCNAGWKIDSSEGSL